MGFCQTRTSVTMLNHMITKEFVDLQIPAVSLPACGSWRTANEEVEDYSIHQIHSLLDSGFVPIMHGDCVIDSQLGCTILSGDTIIETLCEQLQPKRVVFLTDVEGIYDKPPDEKGATLLQCLHVDQHGGITVPIATSSLQHDVTGGIAFKLKTAISIVSRSKGAIPVFICKIDSESGKEACCHGNKVDGSGTVILYKN